jgi:uncharacterized membrane protein
MINVTLYLRKDCHLCEQAVEDLKAIQETIPHTLTIIDIDSDPALQRSYALDIPVLEVGPFQLKAPFDRQQLLITLGAAADRRNQLERINDKDFQKAVARGGSLSRGDRLSSWISMHYLAVLNIFLCLYIGLPFAAPTFMKAGWQLPAQVIYKIYSPLCNQWAFRSWFLFGEQAYYPHAAARVPGVLTFEQVTGITDLNDPSRIQARLFEGNPTLGYKVAICERCVAIWGTMALFGLIYAASGRKIPRLHWLVWLLLGVMPMGLDGTIQLVSQFPLVWIHIYLPYYESTPLMRTLTGSLFGFLSAWFMFPPLEESMLESRRLLAKKFAYVKK